MTFWVVAPVAIAQVTFHRDVAPLLQKHCQQCHRRGEAAPMSFMSFHESRPWAKAIREALLTRRMPPWFADAAHGRFVNERRLTDREIETVVRWVDGGCLEGDPQDAPALRKFVEGWTIGKPDLVIEMPVEFAVPASGTVEYTFFVVPAAFTEDRWVEKVEVRPGNRSVVHHSVVQVREPGARYIEQAKPGVPFVEPPAPAKNLSDTGEGAFGFSPGRGVEVLGVYVPGGVPYELPPGQARLIRKGSDLIFEIHYTTTGRPAKDRTQVGLIFAKQPPKERVINALIVNENLRIPPAAPNHRVDARVQLHADVELLSVFPHMHLRGKAFELRTTLPDGKKETLLKVPRYDFNWQLTYYLEKARKLPKGSTIECIGWFDNSPNNKANPDPGKEVLWGNQTWEEMLIGFVDLALPVGTDPRVIEGKN